MARRLASRVRKRFGPWASRVVEWMPRREWASPDGKTGVRIVTPEAAVGGGARGGSPEEVDDRGPAEAPPGVREEEEAEAAEERDWACEDADPAGTTKPAPSPLCPRPAVASAG